MHDQLQDLLGRDHLFDHGLRPDCVDIIQRELIGLGVLLRHDHQRLVFSAECSVYRGHGRWAAHYQRHTLQWEQHATFQRQHRQNHRRVRFAHGAGLGLTSV